MAILKVSTAFFENCYTGHRYAYVWNLQFQSNVINVKKVNLSMAYVTFHDFSPFVYLP
jgi:hypothetical protein